MPVILYQVPTGLNGTLTTPRVLNPREIHDDKVHASQVYLLSESQDLSYMINQYQARVEMFNLCTPRITLTRRELALFSH